MKARQQYWILMDQLLWNDFDVYWIGSVVHGRYIWLICDAHRLAIYAINVILMVLITRAAIVFNPCILLEKLSWRFRLVNKTLALSISLRCYDFFQIHTSYQSSGEKKFESLEKEHGFKYMNMEMLVNLWYTTLKQLDILDENKCIIWYMVYRLYKPLSEIAEFLVSMCLFIEPCFDSCFYNTQTPQPLWPEVDCVYRFKLKVIIPIKPP